ncbi:DUF4159 domain-containing protein [Roseibium sp. CAU 1637]|uniref:DUF4159 domain-containing protein n=1 Tax=Roseibium limicola TaxID=2816037 RepID=A0A939EM75_9HYPH|nr:DUF4159 domain-containing protein [Roseibium limicola]
MSSLLPLAFTAPWVLTGLLLLPGIWWLLRLTPPRPQEISFPPLRLLFDINKHEEMPQRSPWWLTLLRLLLAALIILAVSGPVWHPANSLPESDETLYLVIDNGWTSAAGWDGQRELATDLLQQAERIGQPVVFAATAEGTAQPLAPSSAGEALERLRALEPRPWSPDRTELLEGLAKTASSNPPGTVIWLSDNTTPQGLLDAADTSSFAQSLVELGAATPLRVYTGLEVPLGLKGINNNAEALSVTVVRHPDRAITNARIRASDLKGLVLGEAEVSFSPGATEAIATFNLPSELRNDIARLDILGERAAGAVQLVDDSWRRRVVGLVSGQSSSARAQPLLSPLYYLRRALGPFADLREPREADLDDAIPNLIDQGISVLVLADVGRLPPDSVEKIGEWVRNGGTLLRFSGPRTAGGTDDLIPVRLRSGGRSLGGALSWKQPQKLAPFLPDSPFAGIPIPDEATVTRQVLAEPSTDLPDRTWAMLEDGTPLVTARALGLGSVVLFHVTAGTEWSNLPLSGVFLDMLRRVLNVSNAFAAATASNETIEDPTNLTTERNVLPPLRLLDGRGSFASPPADISPVQAVRFDLIQASRISPPGLYGTDDGFRALNLLRPEATLSPLELEALGSQVERLSYPTQESTDLCASIFTIAFLLACLDALAIILLAGGLSRLKQRSSAAQRLVPVFLIGMLALSPLWQAQPAFAQASSTELRDMEASLETHLAYVVTGKPEIDTTSDSGLYGLSRYLSDRTALEPGAPIGVDITRDELAFYSLLYWPIDPTAQKPDARTMSRIDTFMRNGGTILFDTKDQITAGTNLGTSPATLKLREILDGLDIPPLQPVPPDHVLTKAFYILDSFPGRYASSPLWVESLEETGTGRPVRAGDGVTPLLISGNDFAAAWAMDQEGRYLYPTVPDDPMQREYAFRSGVNMVMYSLTGNYKADQVHIPALLERLGQ